MLRSRSTFLPLAMTMAAVASSGLTTRWRVTGTWNSSGMPASNPFRSSSSTMP
jgi:hypothetical protein